MNFKKIILLSIGLLLVSSVAFCVYQAFAKTYKPFTKDNIYVSGRYETLKNGISFSQSGTTVTFGTDARNFSVLIENNTTSQDSVTNWFSVFQNETFLGNVFLKRGKHLYPIEMFLLSKAL